MSLLHQLLSLPSSFILSLTFSLPLSRPPRASLSSTLSCYFSPLRNVALGVLCNGLSPPFPLSLPHSPISSLLHVTLIFSPPFCHVTFYGLLMSRWRSYATNCHSLILCFPLSFIPPLQHVTFYSYSPSSFYFSPFRNVASEVDGIGFFSSPFLPSRTLHVPWLPGASPHRCIAG